jgi:serine/threonine protein kinase
VPSAPQLPVDFGPFRLVRRLGGGGMAEVFLGTVKGVKGFEKVLAVKTIHDHLAESRPFIEMLIDEAKLAVQLQHANIVQVFDLARSRPPTT